jgi:hypothetical protein
MFSSSVLATCNRCIPEDTQSAVRALDDMKAAARLRHREAYRKAGRLFGHARQEAMAAADEALALDLQAARHAARIPGPVVLPDNANVDRAEAALRAFGDPSRTEAALLLKSWRWSPELSRAEQAAVLARFVRLPSGGAR